MFVANGALVHFAQVQLHGISVDNSVATGNVLSDAIIALYMASLKLYFNILYVVRAVFALLLLAVAPIVIWTYVLNLPRLFFWGELDSLSIPKKFPGLASALVASLTW